MLIVVAMFGWPDQCFKEWSNWFRVSVNVGWPDWWFRVWVAMGWLDQWLRVWVAVG